MLRTNSLLLCAVLAACPAPSDADDDAGAGDSDGDGSTTDPAATGTDGAQTADDGGASSDGAGSEEGEASTGGEAVDGCGTDPGLSGAVSGQVEIEGEMRRFVLVVPDGYDPDRAYPFVFMFHGRGSNGEEFRMYNRVEEASAGNAILVYPDALPNAAQGGQTGWDLSAVGIDVPFMDRLLADFTANLCIDQERIFATGHSHGGFFSNALACARGETLRAIAPVAAGGPGQGCEGSVAVWLAHHPDDNVVPIVLGQASLAYWTEANACAEETVATDPEPCVEYQGCNEGHDVVWCQHMDDSMIGPHSWPAFAGEAIWDFFSRY